MIRTPAFLAALACASAVYVQPVTQPFDIILSGGTVFDGTGSPGYRADIGVRNGRIAAVGDIGSLPGTLRVDVTGLYVAPGFINIHSHPIAGGLSSATNMLTQGVTTEIVNPDGGGPLLLGQQLAAAAAAGLAVNMGAYIGFNTVWSTVVGNANRRPDAGEVEKMRQLVNDGLAAGAWGVSSGLDYKPAYFAQVEDVIGIVSAASAWRTNFTNHDRITPESNFSSMAGIAETVAIGARAGLLPVVTHMKAQGIEQGRAPAILQMMARGPYAVADAYPYLAGQSGLGALIVPGWAQEGGREAMLARFADPAMRARVVAEAEQAMQARFGGPEGVYVTTIRRELTDVMREMGVGAGEAVVRLLERQDMGAILRFGAEPDLVAILKHPTTSIACDCGATPGQAAHPRYYGSFPRVLGRYVRETKALTWADAIRKMTALPAATIGMIDRGLLAPGMAADLVAFDPATVIDRATFDDPTVRSVGVRYVLVNGRFALRDGEPTGERAGRPLERRAYMPSRSTSSGSRRLTVDGTLHGARIRLDIRQRASDRGARGTFILRDPGAGTRIESVRLGHLQVTRGWASFTGWVRELPSGDERSITVVVDQGDPARPGVTRVVLETGGRIERDGTLDGRVTLR